MTNPPPHRKHRQTTLTKMAHVRAELAKLYSEARNGALPVGDASKLGHLLQILAKIIEGSDLESRVAELEKRLKQ